MIGNGCQPFKRIVKAMCNGKSSENSFTRITI